MPESCRKEGLWDWGLGGFLWVHIAVGAGGLREDLGDSEGGEAIERERDWEALKRRLED